MNANKLLLAVALFMPLACYAGHPVCYVNRQLAVVQPYYYTVQQQYTAPYVSASDVESQLATAERLEKLRAGLSLIQRRGAADQLQAPQQLQQALQAPPATGNYQQQPLQAVPESSLDSQVSDIFRTNRCYQCHGEGKQAGVSANLQGMNELSRLRVFLHVVGGTMPKGGPPVDANSAEVVRRWAMEGK